MIERFSFVFVKKRLLSKLLYHVLMTANSFSEKKREQQQQQQTDSEAASLMALLY